MPPSLEEIWNELAHDLNDKKDAWWTKIVSSLNDRSRKCHNYSYLERKFELYQDVEHLIKNKQAVEYALFFSYIEYGPILLNPHQKNVEHFKNFANECGIAQDSELIKEVSRLIEGTGSCITDEHKEQGAFGTDDLHYFLDLDMAVLGADLDTYEQYWENERQEYEFLPTSMYLSLRTKVLRTFLTIPNIFATKEFREKFEKNARENIQRDVSLLE